MWSGGGYTYTTLSDYANSESCDLGCNQGKKYRCKSGYDYKDGKCTPVPVTPVCGKGEYSSKAACETNHPDTICTQNSSTKCWIGKCDTKSNPYYYESEEDCNYYYQDYCLDDCSNPDACQMVDEDSNCWYIDCYQLGLYSDYRSCDEDNHDMCKFDEQLRCYYPEKQTCDEKYGLFATELDCEYWGWEGPASCTKVGNCWKPDITHIEIYFAEDHRFRSNWDEEDDFSYGHTKFINSSGKVAIDNENDDGNKYEIRNGIYTMNTTDFIAYRGSSINRKCWKMYVRKVVIQGSDGSEAYFDIDFPDGECSDCYPLTYTKKKSIFGTTLGGCTVYNYYYELSMKYEFKAGIMYNVLLYDKQEKCDESCF